jgi:hypothetical protein
VRPDGSTGDPADDDDAKTFVICIADEPAGK